ncbi:ABC transporter permease [Laceyella putida]|uniref:ABC transporter permease n=1 Tax=Laceyella putida TaxID=110101 RepID=A0ABW2RG64_9BACL
MLKLYGVLVRASLRASMQYKTDFLLSALSHGIIMVTDFVLLAAILLKFDDIVGWSLAEVGLLYGISTITMSLYRLLAPELHEFEKYMIQGEFDQLLIRPVSPLFLLLARKLDLGRIGGVVQGVLVLGYSFTHLGTSLKVVWELLLYLPITLLSGLLISFALSIVTATVGFWTERIRDFQSFTLYAPYNAANFPLSIYPDWLKGLFLSILPVGFMNYLPIATLLGKGGHPLTLFISPFFACVFLAGALGFWRFGLRHYHGTGS